MIVIEDLHFSYCKKKILKSISLHLKKGEIVSLIGISGSGKTTLFRLITNLLTPSQGQIQVNGTLSYLRDSDLLLPWRTVLENLKLPSELGEKKTFSKELALKMLKKLGLEGYENAYPDQLSKGMKQRVALARSLLSEPQILLLDEPFSSLDLLLREELYFILKNNFPGITILLVTHDFRDALSLSDRILVLKEGKIHSEFHCCHESESLIYEKIKEAL